MCDINESTRIINAENQDQLIKTRDLELKKCNKLYILLKCLQKSGAENLISISPKEGIRTALETLTFQNYIRFCEEDGCLLGLENNKHVEVSYTERKAIRNYIIEAIYQKHKKIEASAGKLRKDFPEYFNHNDQNQINKEILELESKRCDMYTKLAEIRRKKCTLLKSAAEIKVGPYLKNELEIMLEDYKIHQIKANVLQRYITKELISPTEHTVKAIKKVAQFVEDAMEADEQSGNQHSQTTH